MKCEVIFLSFLAVNLVAAQELNEPCFLRTTGGQGICKLGSDCPQVDRQAKIGITAQVCGLYRYRRLIYCCPVNYNLRPNENSLLNIDEPYIFSVTTQRPRPVYRRKSEQMCAEYTKLLSSTIHVAPLTTDHVVTSHNVENCSFNGQPLITGGTNAVAGEFPYQAAVGYYSGDRNIEWNCGGTLISDYYVVTAAHCANDNYLGAPVKVRLGSLYINSYQDTIQYAEYNIRDVIPHERYRAPATYNDIALLRLASKVRFTDFIRPACLWSKYKVEQNKTVATGWGKTGYADDVSNILQKVSLFVYDNAQCKKSYKSDSGKLPYGIQNTMLCAGDLRGGRDTCQGDSGGPLVTTKKNNPCLFYLVGITSFGKACGIQNTPAVYTRISEYVSWIENIIW